MNQDPAAELGPLLDTFGSDSEFHRFEADGMGTRLVFLLRGALDDDLRAAVDEGRLLFTQLEDRLSKFLPDSELALVNQFAAQRDVPVGRDLIELTSKAKEAWSITGGAFDPTVGPLLEAWGFVDMEAGRRPSASVAASLREVCGMHHVGVDVEAQTLRFDQPGVSLDLGGIGKGYAADLLARHFQTRGVAQGVIICGRSSVILWGPPSAPAGSPANEWHFAVVHPLEPREFIAELACGSGAVSSSGAYERALKIGEHTLGHVFDPRSGEPAVSSVLSATVWSEDALLGDVLSTSLFVLGPAALEPGGVVESLARAWSNDGNAAVGAFLVLADTSRWGGIRCEAYDVGTAPFRVVKAP